jgi:PAS domain-containing protein
MVVALVLPLANALRRRPAATASAPPNPGYSARQLAEVLGALDQGACLFDAELRLVAWNSAFPALAGVAPQSLRPGLAAALVAAAEDRPETAIRAALRHRLSDMQHRRSGCVTRYRPDGSQVEDRWTTLEEGGLLLTCRLLTEPAPLPAVFPSQLA